MSIRAANQSKPPFEHAFVAQSSEKLRERSRLKSFALQDALDRVAGPLGRNVKALALARRRYGKQGWGKPHGTVGEPVPLLGRARVEGLERGFMGAGQTLGGSFQRCFDQTWREPHRASLETPSRALRKMSERLAKPGTRGIEALARDGDKRQRPGQAALSTFEFGAHPLQVAAHAVPRAANAVRQTQNKIGMFRNRPFRGLGR